MNKKIIQTLGYGIILPILYFSSGNVKTLEPNLNKGGLMSAI